MMMKHSFHAFKSSGKSNREHYNNNQEHDTKNHQEQARLQGKTNGKKKFIGLLLSSSYILKKKKNTFMVYDQKLG